MIDIQKNRKYKLEKANNKKQYLVALLSFCCISIVIQSSQLYTKGYIFGIDSLFHMNRIYETMMQLRTGNFSYFISVFGFDQSARIVNAVYGPFISYVLGALLLVSGSWVKFQIITSFLINVLSALGVYRIARKINIPNSISIICGLYYMSTYFIGLWNYSGSFTSFGAAVVPWVLYYGIQMVSDENQNFSVVGLGLSMGIMLQTHFFSAFLVTLALIPFVGYAFFNSNKKVSFTIKMFLSVLLAVLISINVLVSLIHLMGANNIIQTAPNVLSNGAVNVTTVFNNSQANIGIIFGTLYIGQILYLILYWDKSEVFLKLMTITGGIFLFISSSWFPWDYISRIFPALESNLQFPSRIQVIPAVLLTLSFGMVITRAKSKNLILFFCLGAFFSVSYSQERIINRMHTWQSDTVLASPDKLPNGISPEKMRSIFKKEPLSAIFDVIHKGTPDYLPLKKSISNLEYKELDPYGKYWEYIIKPNKKFSKTAKQNFIEVSWNSDKDSKVEVPIIKYKNTVIRQNGKKIDSTTTEIGSLVVNSKKGKNTLEVSYEMPMMIKISILISVISTFFIMLFQAIRIFSKY